MDDSAESDPLLGRTVADGRYEVLARLGTGGMGTVYRVRQHPLGADGGAEADPPRDGVGRHGGRTLRARDARDRGDRAPAHGACLRLRTDRRPAVSGDGVPGGPLAAPGAGSQRRAAGGARRLDRRAGGEGAGRRASGRRRASRPQARQRDAGRRVRRTRLRQGARLRHRALAGSGRRRLSHDGGRDHRDARVHVARAGVECPARRAQRSVFAGRGAVRDARGHAAVRG